MLLFKLGMNKIAQKVGEEAVEVADWSTWQQRWICFWAESADLFHYLIPIASKGIWTLMMWLAFLKSPEIKIVTLKRDFDSTIVKIFSIGLFFPFHLNV
jgi:phosphoribosyl-ATP pyrophosphohydrolase